MTRTTITTALLALVLSLAAFHAVGASEVTGTLSTSFAASTSTNDGSGTSTSTGQVTGTVSTPSATSTATTTATSTATTTEPAPAAFYPSSRSGGRVAATPQSASVSADDIMIYIDTVPTYSAPISSDIGLVGSGTGTVATATDDFGPQVLGTTSERDLGDIAAAGASGSGMNKVMLITLASLLALAGATFAINRHVMNRP